MIVCVCRAVSDRQVRSAVSAGARTLTEVGRRCGAGTGCGACRHQLARLIEQARTEDPHSHAAHPVGCRALQDAPAEATG